MGIKVNAKMYDPIMEAVTVIAKGENRNLVIPVKNRTGKNTTIITNVEANTGLATSKAASFAAENEFLPILRWRSMSPKQQWSCPPEVPILAPVLQG